MPSSISLLFISSLLSVISTNYNIRVVRGQIGDGRRTTDDGRWTTDDGRRTTE
ncbi:MAG TPA: hypothetical protein VJ183_03915 [Chloroflexia bacterium]|nr:hypothetical protein [Chloroflexia bacterium]